MQTRLNRRLAGFSFIALAAAPYSAIIGFHLYAKTQPRTCEERRDLIIGGNQPASFGIVTTCRAWGFWEVSKTLRRDGEE